jgi:hypothetical protein
MYAAVAVAAEALAEDEESLCSGVLDSAAGSGAGKPSMPPSSASTEYHLRLDQGLEALVVGRAEVEPKQHCNCELLLFPTLRRIPPFQIACC